MVQSADSMDKVHYILILHNIELCTIITQYMSLIIILWKKMTFFSLTRLIAHSGQFQFFPNCVGEFSTDTGYIALGNQQRNVQLLR